MTEEKWQQIKSMVQKNYQVLEESNLPIMIKSDTDDLAEKKIGDKEMLIFLGPSGKIKLEYTIKPVVLERKEHYSHRQGANSKTEYIYSDSEFTRRMEAYQWSKTNDEWQKIDGNAF